VGLFLPVIGFSVVETHLDTFELACLTHYRYTVLEYSVHITVEVSSTITVVECLYKCVCKCYDCLHVVLTQRICFEQFEWDKSEAFIDSRFIGALWQHGGSLNMNCTISPPYNSPFSLLTFAAKIICGDV